MLDRLADFAGARKDLEEAVQIFNEVGDKDSAGIVEIELGDVLEEGGDLPGATQHLERALQLEIETGNKSAQASTLSSLAGVLLDQDDLKQAREESEQALALQRDLKRHTVGWKFGTVRGDIAGGRKARGLREDGK